jgi:hypothetical protein
LILLAFVVPLACYCLFLAFVNRSRHPVVISGPWDFAGIVFAASGFLLFGGPAALTGIYERWRMSWLLGQTRFLLGVGEQWHFWVAVWIVYFSIVVTGSAFILLRRRGQTSIYNVDPSAFEDALTRVLDRLDMSVFRPDVQRLLIRPTGNALRGKDNGMGQPASESGPVVSGSEPEEAVLVAEAGPTTGVLALDLDAFPAMRHITVHWHGDQNIRRAVEADLIHGLREVETRDNPVGTWLMSLSVCLFALSSLGLLAVLILRFLQLPR